MIDEITRLRAAEAGLEAAESHPDAFYACFPMASEWRSMQPIVTSSYPRPEATSLDPAPTAPAPVKALAKKLEAAGWWVELTYARGHVPHATLGTPGARPVDSWAVRCQRGSRRAVAVKHDAVWDSFWSWSPDQFFARATGLAHFLDVLAFGPWLGVVTTVEDLKWLGKVHGPALPPADGVVNERP